MGKRNKAGQVQVNTPSEGMNKANNLAEDRVVTLFERRIKPRWRQALWALAMLILLAIIVFNFSRARWQRLATGYARLDTAGSVEALADLAVEFDRQEIAALAQLRKGRMLMEEEKYQQAFLAFEQVENSFAKPRFLIPAQLGQAYAMEAQEDHRTAERTFRHLLEHPQVDHAVQVAAWCGAGRNALALDQLDAAKQAFRRVLELADQGPYAQQARLFLRDIELHAEPPPPIDNTP